MHASSNAWKTVLSPMRWRPIISKVTVSVARRGSGENCVAEGA